MGKQGKEITPEIVVTQVPVTKKQTEGLTVCADIKIIGMRPKKFARILKEKPRTW